MYSNEVKFINDLSLIISMQDRIIVEIYLVQCPYPQNLAAVTLDDIVSRTSLILINIHFLVILQLLSFPFHLGTSSPESRETLLYQTKTVTQVMTRADIGSSEMIRGAVAASSDMLMRSASISNHSPSPNVPRRGIRVRYLMNVDNISYSFLQELQTVLETI